MRHGRHRQVREWLGFSRRARKLHVRLFIWFGGTILATLLVSFVVMKVGVLDRSPERYARQLASFAGERFADAWEDPEQLLRLTQSVHERLEINLRVEHLDGAVVTEAGARCVKSSFTIPVERAGVPVGRVEVCVPGPHHGVALFFALGTAGVILWLASWLLARRLTWPLVELSTVAREIGEGKLDSRSRLASAREDEIGRLARSINEMARRIEQQLLDQKELLAAVSHEIRTPLAHLRVLLELARERGLTLDTVNKVEEEVSEIDDLVDRVLASSRVDFEAVSRRPLASRELLLRALERCQLAPESVVLGDDEFEFSADPSLMRRALANLLDNAVKHGEGVRALGVRQKGNQLSFFVEDKAGEEAAHKLKGHVNALRDRALPRSSSGGLGLGLPLVRRIARAHGGELEVEVLPTGARTSFSIQWAP